MEEKLPSVVVLAAGKGARLGPQADYLHKALLPLDGKPVLTRILEQFPPQLPVIVALGHLADQVKNYLLLAHPERNFTFVTVPDYDKAGSGPGASVACCKTSIQGPFYLTTVDTLIVNPLPPLKRNWLGVAKISEPDRFCTVATDHTSKIESFADKDPKTENRLAFIGLCGIYDTKLFWNALENDQSLIGGEKQLSNGLKGLIQAGFYAEECDWYDTGCPETFEETRAYFENDGFDFTKTSEYTYVVGEKVIKWFQDERIASKRAARAKTLSDSVPKICEEKNHFFSYQLVPGSTLYHELEKVKPELLFEWLGKSLWNSNIPGGFDRELFAKAVHGFYRLKTEKRLGAGFEKTEIADQPRIINGIKVPAISDMLAGLDWEAFEARATPSLFHGDLQFDNIICTQDPKRPFVLIDWRQDFDGLDYGDRYYDLAKLNGGLSLNYADIKAGRELPLSENNSATEVHLEDCSGQILQEYKQKLKEFCSRQGYDFSHIELITALIYLNMSPLHAAPFDRYLIYYGQLRLAQALGTGVTV